MKKKLLRDWIVACAMHFILFALMPVNSDAGICGSTPCVDSADIINGQVTGQDISSTLMMPGSRIVDESVTGADIKNGSLTGTDILDGSIGSADIQDGTLSSVDIGTGAVGTSNISDDAVTSDKIAPGAVGSAQITDGAVNSAKIGTNAVGSSKIIDGSVGDIDVGFNYAGSAGKGGPASDLSCIGCVSQTELNFSIPGNPAHRVVVAASGGDYTSISAALAAINPDANNPYLIDVMPGTYIDNITMKSYIHLLGAGRNVTTIQSSSTTAYVISLQSLVKVKILGFNITGGQIGIHDISSSPIINDNSIVNNNIAGIYINSSSPIIYRNFIENNYNGIANHNSSSIITDNTITENNWHGIVNSSSSLSFINNNIITGNTLFGISNESSSPVIANNIITGNGSIGISLQGYSPTIIGNIITENNKVGIGSATLASTPLIIHNMITDNGGNTYEDISETWGSTPNISFNIYDDILLGTPYGVGMYNVNSSGGEAPAP